MLKHTNGKTEADAAALTTPYAGFWVRVMAAIIDLLLFTPLYIAFKFALPQSTLIAEVIFTTVALIAYTWFFASRHQASPGMRAMNIHIRTRWGTRLSYARALWWGVTGMAGWALALAGVIYLMVNYDLDAINATVYSESFQTLAPEEKVAQFEALTGLSFEVFYRWVLIAWGILIVLCTVWSLSIGLSKEKAGFHNLICQTRFVKGRPGEAGE